MDNELKLLAGLPIEVEGVGFIHPLTLKQVAEIGEQRYNHYLGMICFDVEDMDFTDVNIDKSQFKTFDILSANCIQDYDIRELILEGLSLFFNYQVNFVEELGLFYLGELDEERIIHRDNFDEIKNIIMAQNCLKKAKKEEKFESGNKLAEEFRKTIDGIKKNAPKKTKDEINLFSIISAIAWRSHIGINNVWNLTIYQLYDAYQRLEIVDSYDKTMQGIYAGTISSKSLDTKKINWARNFKLD